MCSEDSRNLRSVERRPVGCHEEEEEEETSERPPNGDSDCKQMEQRWNRTAGSIMLLWICFPV